MSKLKQAEQELLNFKPEKPIVTKTIFGEVVQADPKVCASNSRRLAELVFNFFKALHEEEISSAKQKK